MADQIPSRGGRDDEREKEKAAQAAAAQQAAADSITAALSAEIAKLYHVLGVLNQTGANFCQVMDTQQKGLRDEITTLTKSLDKASNSSTRLGWILIVITLLGAVIAYFGVRISKGQLDVYTAQTKLLELQTEAVKHQSHNRPQWKLTCDYYEDVDLYGQNTASDIVTLTNTGAVFQDLRSQTAVMLQISIPTDHRGGAWVCKVPVLDYMCDERWIDEQFGEVGSIQCYGHQAIISRIGAEVGQMANRDGLRPMTMSPVIYIRIQYKDMFGDPGIEYYEIETPTKYRIRKNSKNERDFTGKVRRLSPQKGKENFDQYEREKPNGIYLRTLNYEAVKQIVEQKLGKEILNPKLK